MDKKTGRRTVAILRRNIIEAGSSVSNWFFILAAEIAFAIIAIMLKTMKVSEISDDGKEGAIPSLYELSEGKKIDTAKLSESFFKSLKESFVPSDLQQTISDIPSTTMYAAMSVFFVTAVVLFFKFMKKKGLQAELQKEQSIIKTARQIENRRK